MSSEIHWVFSLTLLDGRKALRVGRPENDDLVEAVLLLEGADVAPHRLHLLLLAPLQHVVGAVRACVTMDG